MSFDYDKIKQEGEKTDWWASYADLFTMMSVVFLMLYVVSSLRSGTQAIQIMMAKQDVAKRNAELESQIKVYNALKEEQLQQASQDEQQVYQQLMSKLSLLQEEAKDEKNDLRQKARENEQKELALNQYQQLIRNIVNANVLAKGQIKKREEIIKDKDEEIVVLEQDVQEKEQVIDQKEQVINQNEQRIAQINTQLETQLKNLDRERRAKKLTQAQYEKRLSSLRRDSETQVKSLQAQSRKIAGQLQNVKSELESASERLELTQSELAQTSSAKVQLQGELEKARQDYTQQMQQLRTAHQDRLKRERQALNSEIEKMNLTARERAKRLEEFQAQADSRERDLQGRLAGLKGKISETESQLQSAKAEKGRAVASAEALKRENASISAEAAKLREIAEAKKKLGQKIRDNLKKSGVKAEVNERTGDVIINFGDEYFDSGTAKMTPGMKGKLERFIPEYSKSLFEDPELASKLSNVEIIGFASSTYQGKYVNPESLDPKNKEAIDYNLKLSFDRANAIFKHVFDTRKVKFEHQKDLLNKVKVTGRGFLPDGANPKDIPDGMPEKEFCKKYDCKKSQRVVIKFNLQE
jgi:chromosome segregation ATPase